MNAVRCVLDAIRRTVLLCGLGLAATLSTTSFAAYPDRPVRMIVAYPAGGSGDIVARTLAEPLSKAMGQAVVVENIPGASGGIGTQRVIASPPDVADFPTHEQHFQGTRYTISGMGRPLVLIHGVGLTIEHWKYLIPELAPHATVVAYDAIGHGRSGRPASGRLDIEGFVEQLDALVAHLDLDEFDLLGYSMGALIAEGFVLSQPQRVRRLVLLSGVYERTAQEREAVLDRVVQSRKNGVAGYLASIPAALDRYLTTEFRQRRPDVVEELVSLLRQNDLDDFVDAYEFFGTADEVLAPSLDAIRCPTLVITGEDDQRSTALMSRKLAARLPNAELQVLPGQRHMPTLESPRALAATILDYLRADREMWPVAKLHDRTLISTGSRWEETYCYSRALVVGDQVFVSGTTGFDYRAMAVAKDVVAQTWQAFRNIRDALDRARTSLSEVVRVTYYLTEPEDWESVLAVHAKLFEHTSPTSSVVGARLIDPRMKVEIEVTAVKERRTPDISPRPENAAADV